MPFHLFSTLVRFNELAHCSSYQNDTTQDEPQEKHEHETVHNTNQPHQKKEAIQV